MTTITRFVWNPTRDKRRVMHAAAFGPGGTMTGFSWCGRGPFRRSINAPFALGRRICKDCMKGPK